MANSTKVKKDEYGLYVRTDGQLFRPVITDYAYPISGVDIRNDGTSVFFEGALVRVNHISQTPYAKLVVGDEIEYWHSHGCYSKVSTDCWTPMKNL